MHSALNILAVAFALLACGGIFFLVLSLCAALRYLREQRAAPVAGAFAPPVSILKPLRGRDRNLYEALRSHCTQTYPEFEIIFGVNSADDEAVADVERLRREFPQREIKLIVCGDATGNNRKVSNLVKMLRAAQHEYLLINDSDITVSPDYLARVMARLADPRIGLVTALYHAAPGASLASRVEALTIATDFAPGVLSARMTEGGMRFAMGSTLALKRSVLGEAGGLEPLRDVLADDCELGGAVTRAGYTVALCDEVVETSLPAYGWRAMFEHQLRWARNTRDLRRWGYFGTIVTFALPWALLAAACARLAPWSLVLLGTVVALRLAQAWVMCGPVLADRRCLRDLWLISLRDFCGLAVWLASYASRSVTWRGERFTVRDGVLHKTE